MMKIYTSPENKDLVYNYVNRPFGTEQITLFVLYKRCEYEKGEHGTFRVRDYIFEVYVLTFISIK